ncbi:hypothetical protein [Parendozoicomonas sp. Alg238-R29]|uniref:hypothetical protein n=1 Tax=Parendozoicomonas sp. Alg238-R29 TaxID=2993446 RepID=UPI00248F0B38|nr:hypothetical protein [Parendozoicomonas sp. Alg238-R29]
MSNRLKLLPDYGCYALWDIDNLGNINPSELAISDALKKRISRWEDAYDSTLNNSDPSQSGFSNIDDEEAFDLEGRAILGELKLELEPDYEISYFSIVENKLISD